MTPDDADQLDGSAVVRQIAVPAKARARCTLARTDYADAFRVELGDPDRHDAEGWARAVLEHSPPAVRLGLESGWRALGLKLRRDADAVLGWPIRERTAGFVLLGADSRIGMPAQLLFARDDGGLLFATFVQHPNPVARAVWAATEPIHVPTVHRILEHAARRHRPDGHPADVEALTAMINRAYADGEQGLWRPGTPRVFAAEVGELLDAGELLVLHRDGALAGCVRVYALDESTGELGLLSSARRDSGVGGELVALAESWARERGLTRMRLTLLVPQAGLHPFKARLDAWYTRLGYRQIGRDDFAAVLPEPASLLTAPCDLVTYEKALTTAA